MSLPEWYTVGVRQEGQNGISIVDLKGEKRGKGDKGDKETREIKGD